jgi:pyruvate dehydrogenase E2 component (dihydrolipoamide acetyltransferase)
VPAVSTGPGITEQPISKIRQRIGARMVESKQTVPHFYITVEIDMEAALALRKQINEGLPDEQKITVNDMAVKAAALALRQFPNLNSHFYGDKLVRYDHINIGIAVPLDNGGLINVVAKDADITAISRLAQRNREMITAARAGRVRPEDVEGSTFTVSNLGPYDVEHFIAIINPPEAGIIAVGTAREVPVVLNGELKVGTRMKCTLSVDHRVSDGVEGAQFMQALRRLLESPMRLLV